MKSRERKMRFYFHFAKTIAITLKRCFFSAIIYCRLDTAGSFFRNSCFSIGSGERGLRIQRESGAKIPILFGLQNLKQQAGEKHKFQ